MTDYRRQTLVRAPLSEVWRFHSSVDGLVALTPNWMNLRVETVLGPDGEPDPEVLGAGSEVHLSMRPLGVGPRQHWSSRILEREQRDGEAWFSDEMVEGPFPHWVHTHRFTADGDDTLVTDEVAYELPIDRKSVV